MKDEEPGTAWGLERFMAGWFELLSSLAALGIGFYAVLSNYLGALGEDYRRSVDNISEALDRLDELGDSRDSWDARLSSGKRAAITRITFQLPAYRRIPQDEDSRLSWPWEWVSYNATWPSTVRVGRHLPLVSRVRETRSKLSQATSDLGALEAAEEKEEIERETAWLVFLENAEGALGALWRARIVQFSLACSIFLIVVGSIGAILTVLLTWGA